MIVRRFLQTRLLPLFGGDRRFARLDFIRTYRFPEAMHVRFALEQPEFDAGERGEIFDTLKDYFAICAADPTRPAGMPSRIVDEAWHTFILFTREYSEFCERAFGGYLHHAPAVAKRNDDDIRHTWQVACAREGISSAQAARLPRLFGIDRRLKIPGARYYALSETDAHRMRDTMGVTALIFYASGFAGVDNWSDPIFQDMQAIVPSSHTIGGDGTGFADIGSIDSGGADVGGGGGGCSGAS